MRHTSTYTDLGLNDSQRPINSIQLLSLMLNYVHKHLQTADLTSNPIETDPSNIREHILTFIWSYADKTVLVKDLIEAGCVQTMISGLKMICE